MKKFLSLLLALCLLFSACTKTPQTENAVTLPEENTAAVPGESVPTAPEENIVIAPTAPKEDYNSLVWQAQQAGILGQDFSGKFALKKGFFTSEEAPNFRIVNALKYYDRLDLIVDLLNPEGERSILRMINNHGTWIITSAVALKEAELPTTIQISDEGLEARALYLLDPYILPLSWWMGGDRQLLDAHPFSSPGPKGLPKGYERVFRFSSIELMKRGTEALVTKSYAENCLYPLAGDSYIDFEGMLGWKSANATDAVFPKPQSAKLLSREGGVAEVLVSFEDGTASPVQLLLENGVWKLHSTPYLPNPKEALWDGIVEGQIGQEALEERVQRLFDPYVNPVLWWVVGGDQDRELGGDLNRILKVQNVPLTIGGTDSMWYYPLERFGSLEALERSTEQVVTRDFAATKLYPFGQQHHLFLEQDGCLYGNSNYMVSPGIGSAASAELVGFGEDSAWFVVDFYAMEDELSPRIIELKLEDGLWKLAKTQLDFYFENDDSTETEAAPFEVKQDELEQLITGRFVRGSYRDVPSETQKLVLKVVQLYLGKDFVGHPAPLDRAETYLRLAHRFMVADAGNMKADMRLTVKEMATYLSKLCCFSMEKAEKICFASGRVAADGFINMTGEDLESGVGVYEYILRSIQYSEEERIVTILVDCYEGPYYLKGGRIITEDMIVGSPFTKRMIFLVLIYPDGTAGYSSVENESG